MLKKPNSCFSNNCPLATKGCGYGPVDGPEAAKILVVGEALGKFEAIQGKPFVGQSGAFIDRLFRNVGINRDYIRVDNTCRCQPPNNWLDNAPWEANAIAACYSNLEHTLNNPNLEVVIPMGATAIRRVCNFSKMDWRMWKKPMENFHGTVHRDHLDRFWIVPTWHPSFLMRGNHKLTGVVMADLLTAKGIAEEGWEPEQPTLKIDPPVEWFNEWVKIVLEKAQNFVIEHGYIPWLACDIETPEKEKGIDESEVTVDDPSFIITRVNFAVDFDLDFALTVPWSGPYISGIVALLGSEFLRTAFWNCPTPDQKVLTSDLHWVCVGDIKSGDKLIGFDEEVENGRRVRRYKEVEANISGRTKANVLKITLSDGSTVKTTNRHPWLIKTKSIRDKKDSQKEYADRRFKWVQAKYLEVGMTIQRMFDVWEEGRTKDHGYLAGMFDGEGSLHCAKSTNTMKVNLSQAQGDVLNHTYTILEKFGYSPAKYDRNKRKKDAHIGQIVIGGRTEDVAKFLGEIRPTRLLNKFKPEYLGAIQTLREDDVTIIAIEDLGLQEIVQLSTSGKTYILEGFGAHNSNYDRPRLIRNGCPVTDPWIDVMDAWHFLQSSLPRGLGFVAPFYSRYGAWKHLSGSEPGKYAAIDALQTVRISVGVEEDLRHNAQWDLFERHGPLVDRYALKPAEAVGIRVETDPDSPNSIHRYEQVLSRYKRRLLNETRKHVPEELIPLEPKNGYKRQPLVKGTKDPRPGYFTISALEDCYKCHACGQADVTTKHRCKERKVYEVDGKKALEFGEWEVTKWYTKGEFNPNSPQQMLDYIKFKGHKPGKQKKTNNASADADTIEKLYKKHGDELYGGVLKLRKVSKIKGTYVDGAVRLADEKGRIHPVFTNKPSTWRMSCQGFNLQNVVSAGKREDMGLGQRFRQCVVAEPGCYLVEADFAGIEAVEVGWFANDPQYVRLAKLSTHAFITTNMKGFDDKVAKVDWDDDTLREYLGWVKKEKKYKLLYNRAKRVVHGSNYGLTAMGLRLTYPEDFPTVAAAQEVIDLMFDLFPSVKQWQHSTRQRAHEQHYLGGSDHPFRYKHWFWNVYNFTRISVSEAKAKLKRGQYVVEIANQWYEVNLGSDAKKCIAFYPQSTSGGVLREALLALFTPESEYYIGDVFFGKTPLRTPIHDSIVLEVPEAKLIEVTEKLYGAMTLPIMTQPLPWNPEEYLQIGVDMEFGRDWGHMEGLDLAVAA